MSAIGKQERIKRLKKHLANLEAGGSISKRDMKSLLTGEQMQQYDNLWRDAQNYKQDIIDGRSVLESYTAKLKAADAIWTRFEDAHPKNSKKETEYLAYSAYESALECLEEILEANPYAIHYLDRPVSFEASDCPDTSAGEMPRYKLSKSCHVKAAEFDTKIDIKIQVIEDAIAELLSNKQKQQTDDEPAAAVLAKLRKLGVRT